MKANVSPSIAGSSSAPHAAQALLAFDFTS